MFKKLLAFIAAMSMVAAFAAVDVNKATLAELDGIRGIGPGISSKIVEARTKGSFKDWNDFIERVNGVGEKNAAKFSAEGMTVGGASYSGTTSVSSKKDEKSAAKAKRQEMKAQKKAEKKAAEEHAAKPEKPDVKFGAKDVKKDGKTDASKPAASAAKK